MVFGSPYSKICLVVLCCLSWIFLLPFSFFSFFPIFRVLSFKVFPKCQFNFLVLQIITIPLLIWAVPLHHPSSPLLGWAASSQVQTSQCNVCFLTSGNIMPLPRAFHPKLFLVPLFFLSLFCFNSTLDWLEFRVCGIYILLAIILY